MNIDPILFEFDIGFTVLTIRWYGLLIVLGALAAAYYGAWYVKRRGEDPNLIWDSLIWILLSGIVGARIWYVVADIIGGNSRYLDDPFSIILINQGGLNILGGIILAVVAAWYYTQRNQIDFWLLADAIAPGYLIGQAIGRLGNFINQELYGPPTTLPWGLSIEARHRIPPWNDLAQYPVDSTFFHPTFAYEMLWNLIFAGIITYLVVRYSHKLASGMMAGGALVATGIGRALLEANFRPDQPAFFGLGFSTSMLLALIFAGVGLFIILVKSGRISVPFMQPGATEYASKPVRRPPAPRKMRRNKA